MTQVLIEPQYLPPLEYFASISRFDCVVLEAHEHYQKQTYRNRCYIATANGVHPLTVPVSGGNKKIKISETEIDYKQKWVNEHWRTITSAYGKAPYFEYYAHYFKAVYDQKPRLLSELNQLLLTTCLKILKSNLTICYTDNYLVQVDENITDLRSVIHPKSSYQSRPYYKACTYYQVFSKNFIPDLSIIDLIFCQGPEAKNILARSLA